MWLKGTQLTPGAVPVQKPVNMLQENNKNNPQVTYPYNSGDGVSNKICC